VAEPFVGVGWREVLSGHGALRHAVKPEDLVGPVGVAEYRGHRHDPRDGEAGDLGQAG